MFVLMFKREISGDASFLCALIEIVSVRYGERKSPKRWRARNCKERNGCRKKERRRWPVFVENPKQYL